MEFQVNLMELRKQKGWSQEELGNRLGVTRQTISKWELGQTTPEMDKLLELSRLFEISLDDLLGNPYHGQRKEQRSGIVVENRQAPDHYEYKSSKTICGIPLIHINLKRYGIGVARGILAIGNASIGVVAIGAFSLGIISVGGLVVGLLSLGGLAAGIFAVGGVAAGFLSIGGVAFGVYALGGCAIGSYAIGATAVADKVAMGFAAQGDIAIGESVEGITTFYRQENINYAELEAVILQQFPNTSRLFLRILKFAITKK